MQDSKKEKYLNDLPVTKFQKLIAELRQDWKLVGL